MPLCSICCFFTKHLCELHETWNAFWHCNCQEINIDIVRGGKRVVHYSVYFTSGMMVEFWRQPVTPVKAGGTLTASRAEQSVSSVWAESPGCSCQLQTPRDSHRSFASIHSPDRQANGVPWWSCHWSLSQQRTPQEPEQKRFLLSRKKWGFKLK